MSIMIIAIAFDCKAYLWIIISLRAVLGFDWCVLRKGIIQVNLMMPSSLFLFSLTLRNLALTINFFKGSSSNLLRVNFIFYFHFFLSLHQYIFDEFIIIIFSLLFFTSNKLLWTFYFSVAQIVNLFILKIYFLYAHEKSLKKYNLELKFNKNLRSY